MKIEAKEVCRLLQLGVKRLYVWYYNQYRAGWRAYGRGGSFFQYKEVNKEGKIIDIWK